MDRRVAGVLCALLLGCGDPSRRIGTPEFFERITGLALAVDAPRFECHRGGNTVGRAALYRYDLAPEQVAWFRDPPAGFREHPRLDGPAEGREYQTWRTGVAQTDDERELTGQALAAVYWVLGGDCDGDPQLAQTVGELRASLGRATTHFSGITLPQQHGVLVMNVYVVDVVQQSFYVIDADP